MTTTTAGLSSVLRVETALSAQEAFEKFLRLSVADGAASPRTIASYREGLTAFLTWCGSERLEPQTLNYDGVEYYRSSLVKSGLKRSTIKLRLVAVRALYTAFQRWGVRPDNPAAGVKAPKEKEAASSSVLRKALSPAEARHFLSVLPGSWAPQDVRDATICRLMLFHGLRAEEVTNLNSDSLDYQSFSDLRVNGKGDKLRTIILCPETRKDLIAWTAAVKHPQFTPEDDFSHRVPLPLFFGFDKPGMNRLSVRAIERIVDRYLKVAGLKRAGRSAHALRHTAAVLAVLGGAEREAIADAFGHASTHTTDIYARAAAAYQDNPADAVSRALEGK